MYGTLVFVSSVIPYSNHDIAGTETVCLIRLIRILQSFLNEFIFISTIFEFCLELLIGQVSRLREGYLAGVFIDC